MSGAVLTPGDESELGEAIRGARGGLRILGGGTRGAGAAGEALSVGAIAGVTLHEPGALTLVARAGTPLGEVETTLRAEGQRLPFEPMDHRALLGVAGTPTIGGVVAANVSGPRRIQAGACRDSLIGVRFVDGTGAAISNGGRVMKNVTGYDLVKLMAGSRGTLGVLTELSFKVLPAPETEATLILDELAPGDGVAVLSAGLATPFEVSGAAYRAGRTLLRLEGFADSVAYRASRLRAALARFGDAAIEDDPPRSAELWRAVRDVTDFADRPGDVWRVSVKPTDGPVTVARAQAEEALLDWGGGLVWLLVAPGTDLRARLGAIAGHATLVRADAATHARLGTFHPEPPALATIATGLRAKFDPRGVLNPGLMG